MPPLGPVSRRVLIRSLRRHGFRGPVARGRHALMDHPDGRTVYIPNPHGGAIDYSLVRRILRQAGIDPKVWELL